MCPDRAASFRITARRASSPEVSTSYVFAASDTNIDDAIADYERSSSSTITFRDGPTGRRAGLIGGPDVWEVAMWIDDLGPTKDPAAELAADRVVSRPQIDAVLAYRAAYPDEIQAKIDLHRSETAAAETR